MRWVLPLILVSLGALGSGCASLAWKDRPAAGNDPLRGDRVVTTPGAAKNEVGAKLKEPQADDGPLRPGSAAVVATGDRKAMPATMPSTLAKSPAALAIAPRKSLSDDGYLGIDRSPRPVDQANWSPPRPTWEQLQDTLKTRGITDYTLEQTDGVWHFRCYVPSATNPQAKRFYEGESANKIDAVMGVLKKMDERR